MANDSCGEDRTANASVGEKESPLACDLGAFTDAEKPRYVELRKALAAAVIGKRELPDGIEKILRGTGYESVFAGFPK
jgi:hypothetical protein